LDGSTAEELLCTSLISPFSIDGWPEGATSTRPLLIGFLQWTAARGLTTELVVPQRRAAEPDLTMTDEHRWELLRACLHNHLLPLDVRAAGALVLLYGQSVTRIVELIVDQVTTVDSDHVIDLARHQTLIPPALSDVLEQLRASTILTPIVGREGAGPPYLFPGARAGQPMTAAAMLAKLSRCGIPVRRARNVALLALAAEVPAAALSPLLGIGLETAVRWTYRANRDWHGYVQARATSPEEPS
jgi:hypothetical protein